MKTFTICLLSCLAILLPTVLPAQSGKNLGKNANKGIDPATLLARLDTDQNGSLSKDELRNRMADRFDAIDTNSDGAISVEELATAREQARQRVKERGQKLKDADTDGNRAISLDEASDAGMDKLVEHFAVVDQDGDGEISREELRAFRKESGKRKGATE